MALQIVSSTLPPPPHTPHWLRLQSELGYPAEALEPLPVAEPVPPLPRPALPPYNGYGALEDSLQNCVALVPKPPKKVTRLLCLFEQSVSDE